MQISRLFHGKFRFGLRVFQGLFQELSRASHGNFKVIKEMCFHVASEKFQVHFFVFQGSFKSVKKKFSFLNLLLHCSPRN